MIRIPIQGYFWDKKHKSLCGQPLQKVTLYSPSVWELALRRVVLFFVYLVNNLVSLLFSFLFGHVRWSKRKQIVLVVTPFRGGNAELS